MTLPNFLIIGAAKSGTTSMADYCQQHPQVFMSNPKEPNFFYCQDLSLPPDSGPVKPEILKQRLYQNSTNSFEAYQRLFTKVSGEKVIGEASVRYLYYPQVAIKIKEYLSNPKLLIMLRNPVERLYSHYLMNVRHLLEYLPLEKAIAAEKERINSNWGYDWHYVGVSSYYAQVKTYFDLFPPQQLKVIILEEFLENPLATIQDLYKFLEIDPQFVPSLTRKLEGYWPKSFLVHRLTYTDNPIKNTLYQLLPSTKYYQLLKWIKNNNQSPKPLLSQVQYQRLEELFKDDIRRLEGLLERDLPW